MRIRFLSVAGIELDQAIEYYEHQMQGLGLRFFHEIDKSITRIQMLPQAWSLISLNTRRCLVSGFPYAIFYVIGDDEIIVTAIAHLHRNPLYFKNRII